MVLEIATEEGILGGKCYLYQSSPPSGCSLLPGCGLVGNQAARVAGWHARTHPQLNLCEQQASAHADTPQHAQIELCTHVCGPPLMQIDLHAPGSGLVSLSLPPPPPDRPPSHNGWGLLIYIIDTLSASVLQKRKKSHAICH